MPTETNETFSAAFFLSVRYRIRSGVALEKAKPPEKGNTEGL